MTERTTRDILVAARKLIEKPENWTKGENARTSSGFSVGAFSDSAFCFCSVGAISRAAGADWETEHRALNTMRDVINESVIAFNDTPERTHPEVLAAFDKAIAASPKD